MKHIKQIILDHYDYDRIAERKIFKSLRLFKKGGTYNHWRAIRLYCQIRKKYGCDIWPGIQIGEGTYISHAQNISIGQTAIIGKNCKIYPSCSIASAIVGDKEKVARGERRHAKIGDNCILGEGCCITGKITIGHDAIIGVGAVVRHDIPAYAVVVGNPCKIVGFTMRPDEAYENEVNNYPESERMSLESLEKNYNKYFLSRLKEIRDYCKS